jgi:uncharacterized repeat protein (TIGR03803 family)
MRKHMLCLPSMAMMMIIVLFAAVPTRAAEKVLYSFCPDKSAGCPDGANPVADLVLDAAGNIWGTTKNGGQSGLGTVFELTASSGFTKLGQVYSFRGGANDGANPEAGLVFSPATGILYGTTASGGSSNCNGGCGTVFALQPGSSPFTDQILHFFSGAPRDGANPTAELLMDASGDLYGTTANGGSSAACNGGCGTVFLSNPLGYRVIHNFAGSSDGANPAAGLVFDAQNNLWGTAREGGANGFGTVFELTAAPSFGLGEVYSFKGVQSKDGANPAAALTFDTLDIDGGYLYGTTSAGGLADCAGGCGTVFELQPMTGSYERIYSFTGKNGAAPIARLAIETTAGNSNYGSLYGTASLGGDTAGVCGTAGCGTAFEICPPTQTCPWKETTLFRFNGIKGQTPAAGMLLSVTAPDNPKSILPPQIGKGTCTSNCIAAAAAGGTQMEGVVYQITGP